MKKRLYLVQVNQKYGENTYLPYSVGLLWAYARTFKEVTDNYEMCGFIYLKESIDKVISKIENPDLVAVSCYIWNWEWNKEFMRAIKEKWPKCCTLVGGVHVYDQSPRTLKENPFIDFAIYGEGEGAFVDFLTAVDYSKCDSLVWRREGEIVVNPRHQFMNLNTLRSPYLDGIFDDLLPLETKWTGAQETNRGCPYRCCFCEWGSASLDKLRLFSDSRVYGELEWFANHKTDYLENCDANWGIVRRDVEYTKRMVDTKKKTGFPKRFRAAFAKNSNETIWEIANLLHGADMLKSVTLALQSVDDNVLVNIQRKNIKFDKFGELVMRYRNASIPTYTELILGLPGETKESYINGIDKILDAGQHAGLFCYMNISLPNTEQSNREYVKLHGIKTVPMKAMLLHGTVDQNIPREIQNTIVETKTMSHKDWWYCWLYSRIIECFHCLGLTRHLAYTCVNKYEMKYSDFYISFMKWLQDSDFCECFWFLTSLLKGALKGRSWDCIDPRFGDISWPPEEFVYLKICMRLDEFYGEMEKFLEFLPGEMDDKMSILHEQNHIVGRPPEGGQELIDWCQESVWYERKGKRGIK